MGWPALEDLAPLAATPRPAARPRTVVQLVPSLGFGGAERLACTIHRLALASGWCSRLLAPPVPALREALAVELGGPVEPLEPALASDGDPLLAWARAVRAQVRRAPPSLVHAHLAFPDRYGVARLAAGGQPLLASFQLLPGSDAAPWPPDALFHQRCDRLLALYARLPSPTRLVAPSDDDARRLARWVPASRVRVIANAPPLPRLAPPAPKPCPWPDERSVVRLLSAGRLHEQKGYDRMLRALARPPAEGLAWCWVLAGEGPEGPALERLVDELGLRDRVRFVRGYTADELYPQADLVLAPSRYEGMPLVPPEAIDAGVAVLASDLPSHRAQLATALDALLAPDEARWPAQLAPLLADGAARRTLHARQRSGRPADARGDLFRAYDALYAELSGE